jgi:hypothetical protein
MKEEVWMLNFYCKREEEEADYCEEDLVGEGTAAVARACDVTGDHDDMNVLAVGEDKACFPHCTSGKEANLNELNGSVISWIDNEERSCCFTKKDDQPREVRVGVVVLGDRMRKMATHLRINFSIG